RAPEPAERPAFRPNPADGGPRWRDRGLGGPSGGTTRAPDAGIGQRFQDGLAPAPRQGFGQGGGQGGGPRWRDRGFAQPAPGQPAITQPGQPNIGQPNLGQPNFGQPNFGQRGRDGWRDRADGNRDGAPGRRQGFGQFGDGQDRAPFDQRRFDDRRFNDQRFDDRRFDDRRFNGQRFNDPRFNGQRFDDRRFNDQRFNDPRFNGRRFDDRRFNDRRFFDQRFNNGFGNRNWNRDWRRDQRYDWRGWRDYNRFVFRQPPYRAPFGWGFGYRRFAIGITLQPFFFDQQYWIADPFYYHLPPAYYPYQWVRYYNDALLVDVETGEVVDAIYDIFW
ncbi:MAG: RcnB family protein, partial [Sphingomonas sp.]|nr:RcnB family protein [Sphingomonas sp.]